MKMWAQPQLTAWLGNGDEHGVLVRHRSVIPEADAGLEGMEFVTHLKDDMSWGVEAEGGAASQAKALPTASLANDSWCCFLAPTAYVAFVRKNMGNVESCPDLARMAACHQWVTDTNSSH